MKQTQTAWVFAQLKRGKVLTAVSAYEGFGIMRLAAVIHELRGKGHDITTTEKRKGSVAWAEYRMKRGGK